MIKPQKSKANWGIKRTMFTILDHFLLEKP